MRGDAVLALFVDDDQVEMVPEVEDSVAVGLRVDGDVEVVLFVKLAPITERDTRADQSQKVREEI